VYGDVLAGAQVAGSKLIADEERQRNEARALLYAVGEGGIRIDSPTLRTYRACRDAVLSALEQYRSAEQTASAAGPDALAAWKADEGALLRAGIASLQRDWETQGAKDAVERALALEAALARRGAGAQWNEWRSGFDPSLDLITDLDQEEFALTGIQPSNAFDLEWPTFTLSKPEIAALARSAPAEIRDMLASDAVPSAVESMTFEFRSVALNRPWFDPRVFQARCWRLGVGESALSDGASPPSGRLPGYAVRLVLARNIELTERQSSGTVEKKPFRSLPLVDPSKLRTFPVKPTKVLKPRPKFTPRAAPFGGVPLQVAAAPTRRADAMIQARGRTGLTLAASDFRASPLLAQLAAVPTASRTSTSTPPPTRQRTYEDISILAFICRRLGRCPDPDPNLDWSGA